MFTSKVLGTILISHLSFVCCLLTSFPLWVCIGEVVARWVCFLLLLCINAKPVWLTDDLPWSGSNHVMVLTGCACCRWFSCCLVVLCYVILPNIYATVCHIMGCIGFPDFSFPALERPPLAHWCFCGSVYKLWFWSLSHFPWCHLCKNVLQLPWCFLTYSHKYSSKVMMLPHLCFEFCVMSLPVFITHMV